MNEVAIFVEVASSADHSFDLLLQPYVITLTDDEIDGVAIMFLIHVPDLCDRMMMLLSSMTSINPRQLEQDHKLYLGAISRQQAIDAMYSHDNTQLINDALSCESTTVNSPNELINQLIVVVWNHDYTDISSEPVAYRSHSVDFIRGLRLGARLLGRNPDMIVTNLSVGSKKILPNVQSLASSSSSLSVTSS